MLVGIGSRLSRASTTAFTEVQESAEHPAGWKANAVAFLLTCEFTEQFGRPFANSATRAPFGKTISFSNPTTVVPLSSRMSTLVKPAGFTRAEPTPSIALGSYDSTPLEIAGAYTIFANGGTYVEPHFVSSVQDQNGLTIYNASPEKRSVLDPKVAFQMVDLLQEVLRSGTAAGVRSRGFVAPAAGKTGTSRDGWFAGFTSGLLCIVWVGFDDHRDLNLEGARSALPIWTEFMKRAVQHGADAKPFRAPPGIVGVEIDPESGELATPFCESSRMEFFVSGTEPQVSCHLHDAGQAALPPLQAIPQSDSGR